MNEMRWIPASEGKPPVGEITVVSVSGKTEHNLWIGALGLAAWFGDGPDGGWELIHPAVESSAVTVTHYLAGLPEPPEAEAWEAQLAAGRKA